jgi:hypothetical protein
VPTDEEESWRRGQPEYDLSRLTGDRSDDQKKTKRAAEADPVERAAFHNELAAAVFAQVTLFSL